MKFLSSLSLKSVLFATYMWGITAFLTYYFGHSTPGFNLVFLLALYPVMLLIAPLIYGGKPPDKDQDQS